MNIFVVDEDPRASARQLIDRHVCKMILESAQMISTVAQGRGFQAPYKATHENHPCTRWVGSHPANMRWLFEHAFELCAEYTLRYQKIHASQRHLESLWNDLKLWWPEVSNEPWSNHTRFAQAMPEEFRNECSIQSYRTYYRSAKRHIASWKLQDRKPDWF